jgi:hypothetical protein
MSKGTSFTVHDLPKPERPRERLKNGFFSFKEKGLIR